MQPDKARQIFDHLEHHRYRVITSHERTFDDPLHVIANEEVTLTGKEDYWAGRPEWCWLEAIGQDGKKGWIPKSYVALYDDETLRGRVLQNYDANELSVTTSEIVSAGDVVNGWR